VTTPDITLAALTALEAAPPHAEPWPGIVRGGATFPPPLPPVPAVEGACPRCGGLGGYHMFRNCNPNEETSR
jgi:hypothetical protein